MKVTKPTVRQISRGKAMHIKQMSAKGGELLPKHLANVESVVVVTEGKCVVDFEGEDHDMGQGDSLIIPKDAKHQIRVVEDFKAYHIMPNDIEFEFFEE